MVNMTHLLVDDADMKEEVKCWSESSNSFTTDLECADFEVIRIHHLKVHKTRAVDDFCFQPSVNEGDCAFHVKDRAYDKLKAKCHYSSTCSITLHPGDIVRFSYEYCYDVPGYTYTKISYFCQAGMYKLYSLDSH